MAAVKTPETIAELVEAIEKLFTVGQSTAGSRAVTGEPYISFCLGGVRDEGERPSVWSVDEKAAVECFWLHFLTHTKDKPSDSVFYWRRKPEITVRDVEEEDFDSREGGKRAVKLLQIHARFLVSNKPPLSESEWLKKTA